jgi:hypothetical protein
MHSFFNSMYEAAEPALETVYNFIPGEKPATKARILNLLVNALCFINECYSEEKLFLLGTLYCLYITYGMGKNLENIMELNLTDDPPLSNAREEFRKAFAKYTGCSAAFTGARYIPITSFSTWSLSMLSAVASYLAVTGVENYVLEKAEERAAQLPRLGRR